MALESYESYKTTKTVMDEEEGEGGEGERWRMMEAKYKGLTANFASVGLYTSPIDPRKLIHYEELWPKIANTTLFLIYFCLSISYLITRSLTQRSLSL
jgi:hypothetical protein